MEGDGQESGIGRAGASRRSIGLGAGNENAMHIVTTRPADANLPIFFNVDTSVGKQGRNSSQEDILLVKLLLKVTAEAATAKDAVGEARRQRVLKVPVTGVADAATMDGIHA